MTQNDYLSLVVDADGVATILWKAQDGGPNVFSEGAIAAFAEAVETVATNAAIKGVIIASAAPVFHAGADLKLITAFFERTPEQLWPLLSDAAAMFQTLEGCGKPVVAAIGGHALGGGFEMALACHARIVADKLGLKLGLPEASIGLMPGFGGTQRLARIGDDYKAATRDLVKGRTWNAQDALAGGYITAIVPAADLMEQARQWVLNNPGAAQPWASRSYVSPAVQPGFESFFTELSAGITRSGWGNYPAERLIAEAVYHGLQLPIGPALRLEVRRFIEITRDPSARAMTRTNFFSMKDARNGKRRPASPVRVFHKIGVIGGGLMGGGIAYQAAKSALSVVVIDLDQAAAERGRHYSERLLDRAIQRGQASEADKASHLARILATTDFAALADCDLVIEAVFENAGVKNQVLQQAEAAMRPDAVLASNTSTIPIGQLAAGLSHKDRFIGLHFFSPVEKMALVEIISGADSTEATLAAGFDLARVLGKTPVAVRDGRAFFTTRVVVGYMQEGMALLAAGVAPALIENAGRKAGMPMGPLRLTDMVNVDLIEKIEAQFEADLGADYSPHPGRPVGLALLAQGRAGEKNGAGFYDYGTEGPQLWSGLAELFPPAATQPDIDAVAEQLMFRQAVETLRCFDDGVLTSAADADVGSVLGWGFAPHTGGVASYIDRIGAARLLDYCLDAEARLGRRFAPARKLRELAQTGTSLAD